MDNNSNAALICLHARKSVRHYKSAELSEETLLTLVKAGMAAASAKNMQPWAFVITTDRKILDMLADTLPYAKMLFNAPAAITVCGIPDESAEPHYKDFWIMDCSAATENILLAAEALGLGAVWTAAYPYPERMDSVRRALGLPEKVMPLCVIPVGVPTGEDKPKEKFKPENVHWQRWQQNV
jgi:nitroreductase